MKKMIKIQSANVKIRKDDYCIEATGKNADLLIGVAAFALIVVGMAALVSASNRTQ